MNGELVAALAKIHGINAEIEGMKAANEARKAANEPPLWNQESFVFMSNKLYDISAEVAHL